jgi:DNA-binding winged helix-turn-helix (wHTH) protein/Flp pilus assembly protein TadD
MSLAPFRHQRERPAAGTMAVRSEHEIFTKSLPPDARGPREVYQFAGFTLDIDRGQLSRGHEVRDLRPQSFDVLTYLVRQRGRLVSRRELLAAVWPDVTVSDDSLVQCLVDVRRALGEAAESLRTVRGRGYRFDAVVARVSERPVPAPDVHFSPAADPRAEETGSASGTWGLWGRAGLMSVVLVAVVVASSWWLLSGRVAGSTGTARPVGGETLNGDAARAFADARALAAGRSRSGLLRAVERYDAALALDPQYAAAWIGLSETLTVLHIYGAAEPRTLLPRARDAAERALRLDPALAGAHTALAHVLEQWDHDWASADEHHRRALALDPASSQAHQVYAMFLVGQGRFDEAATLIDRAGVLATDTPVPRALRGVVMLFSGRSAEALATFDGLIAEGRAPSIVHYWRAWALAEQGRYDEAMTSALASATEASNEPAVMVGIVHARAGRRSEALQVRRALEAKAATGYVPATEFATLDTALGEYDRALDALERAVREHARSVPSLGINPLFRPLRSHPRFTRLVALLGVPTARN